MGHAKHIPENEHWKHEPTKGGTENGACLFHWEAGFPRPGKETSCFYRWQGFKETRPEIKKIYENYPLAKEQAQVAERGIGSGRLKTSCPAGGTYGTELKMPAEKGDWDLGGPHRPLRRGRRFITPTRNFTKASWPYWNNAHHLIPKGLFARTMMDIKPGYIRELVVAGLFRAPYNINHMHNILFLPMDKEVGMLLQLPRHLTRDEGCETDDPNPCFNHERYNGEVKGGLTRAIKEFKKAAADARKAAKPGEKCDVVKAFKLSKDKLEIASKACVRAITAFGKEHGGAPLVDMDF